MPGATGVYAAPEGRIHSRSGGDNSGGPDERRDRDTLVLVSCSSPTPIAALQTPGTTGDRGGPGHTRVLAFEEDARVSWFALFCVRISYLNIASVVVGEGHRGCFARHLSVLEAVGGRVVVVQRGVLEAAGCSSWKGAGKIQLGAMV